MELAYTLTAIAAVLLTILAIGFARWGARNHQEDLNTHSDMGSETRVTTDPDDLEPKADRPAGPDAEAMRADVGHATPQDEIDAPHRSR